MCLFVVDRTKERKQQEHQPILEHEVLGNRSFFAIVFDNYVTAPAPEKPIERFKKVVRVIQAQLEISHGPGTFRCIYYS